MKIALMLLVLCLPVQAALALEPVEPTLPQEQMAEDFGRSMAKTMLDMMDQFLAQARLAVLGETASAPHGACDCKCPHDEKTI